MRILFLLVFLLSRPAFGQYYPRGTTLNNNYWPNVDEPIRWMINLDGMFDFQNEKIGNATTTVQTTHANFNLFYGGKNFRGGANVVHDYNLVTKDLTVGFGVAFGRPLFIELAAGYLSRTRDTTSTEGWSYHAKLGYNFRWITEVRYRTRFRIALVYNYKTVNDIGDPKTSNFYPIIGFEFET